MKEESPVERPPGFLTRARTQPFAVNRYQSRLMLK